MIFSNFVSLLEQKTLDSVVRKKEKITIAIYREHTNIRVLKYTFAYNLINKKYTKKRVLKKDTNIFKKKEGRILKRIERLNNKKTRLDRYLICDSKGIENHKKIKI